MRVYGSFRGYNLDFLNIQDIYIVELHVRFINEPIGIGALSKILKGRRLITKDTNWE